MLNTNLPLHAGAIQLQGLSTIGLDMPSDWRGNTRARHHAGRVGLCWLSMLLAGLGFWTISSQLLVSSSSLTEDFYRLFLRKNASERETVNIGRLFVALVALVAIYIARDPDSKVLGLVSNAWAGFGSAFGPLILLSLTWKRMTGAGAVSGLVVGAGVVILWISMGWNKEFLGGPGLYEIIPGFVAALVAIVGVSLAGKPAATA